ncbi:hypothetical protein [Paenibacillus sp. AR247]|uniref:hypothetical protein n=1 Tax=Paenibacillus sp. AR247 TaxID=1631599 RepID=UPI0026C15641|nr:hypothetical protein [Paenibacillus sp. AR247]
METTVCPWCQTEIVWDEELGPEDECPYCHNELKGYRTLSIQLGADEEEADVDEEHEGIEGTDWELPEDDDKAVPFWNEEDMQQLPPSIRTLDKYEDSHDLMNYEETVEQILDEQEEVPRSGIDSAFSSFKCIFARDASMSNTVWLRKTGCGWSTT